MTTEWNAAVYHRVSDPQFAWGMAVLDRVALAGDETVVDAGCGSGRVSAALAARVPHGRVIGLDRSRQMAAAAVQSSREQHIDNFTVAIADLLHVPLRGRADLFFSTATFHWILDHPRLFAEIFEALAPGGRLVAQCGGAGNLVRLHDRAHALMTDEAWAPLFTAWTRPWEFASPDVTIARLTRCGFVDVSASLEDAPTPFPDADAFSTFVTTVVLRTHLACLPDDTHRRRFVDTIVAMYRDDPQPFVLDYVRLNLSARKPR